LDFLETNKRAGALEFLETAIQRVEEQQDDVQLSLNSLDNQDEIVDAALAAAEEDNFDEILEQIDLLEEAVTEG